MPDHLSRVCRTIKDWTQSNLWFLIAVLVSTFVILTLLACFADSHQDCPVNSMLTGLFTLFASLSIGASSTFPFYESSLNLIYFFDVTLFISFALIFSLILYAFQSSYDFNLLNCIKYVVLIVTVFVVIYLLLIVVWSYWLALFLPTVAYAAVCGLAFTLVCPIDHRRRCPVHNPSLFAVCDHRSDVHDPAQLLQ